MRVKRWRLIFYVDVSLDKALAEMEGAFVDPEEMLPNPLSYLLSEFEL